MKKLTMIVLLVAVIGVMGCNGTSQERLDGLVAFLGMTQDQSVLIDDDVATLQQTLANLQVAADDPALASDDAAKIEATLTMVAEKLSEALEVKAKIDKAVTGAEAAIAKIAAEGNANIGNEIEAAGQTLVAVSPAIPPPWGTISGIAGTLLAALGGILAKRYKTALVDVVKSVDKGVGVLDEVNSIGIVTELKANQKPATRNIVREIRAA